MVALPPVAYVRPPVLVREERGVLIVLLHHTLGSLFIMKKVALLTTLVTFFVNQCQSLPLIHASVSLLSHNNNNNNNKQQLTKKDSSTVSPHPRGLLLLAVRLRGGSTLAASAIPPAGINPLVLSSPVVTAAVCRDGIVLCAIHSPGMALLTHEEEDGDDDKDATDDKEETAATVLKDLPVDFSGPFRIQSLDLQGTTLLTAGWRADASYFTTKAQGIVSDEREMVGTTAAAVLACQFSLLLATAAAMSGDVSTIFYP